MLHHTLEKLNKIRAAAGKARTQGLDDASIMAFLSTDPELGRAIDAAYEARDAMEAASGELFRKDEAELCKHLQEKILNFYPGPSVNPYVPLGAAGSWIVTSHGAVLHDSGGYGMLGMGHAPKVVLEAIATPFAMANVMTPNFSQRRLTDRLEKEIGRARGKCPYGRFVFLNSGSEAVTFACRVTDIHGRRMTEPGARHAGRKVMRLAITDGFHGRTEGPARLSQSCREDYIKHLASYRESDNILYTPINDVPALRRVFKDAEAQGIFLESFFVEPVMGEGVPGMALDRAFYDEARRLTREMGTLLIVDSIQAALRAQGCLSIVDYQGYEGCEAPDMETYSKALNAGQFPLSVIAMKKEVADVYVVGLYGNTMTGNPRAMEVACRVLDAVTDATRENIRARGKEFVDKFTALSAEFPGAIEQVVGTGLMVSAMLNPKRYRVLGNGGFEQYLRAHGIEMIHGGACGLRFTPSFAITSREVDLIVSKVRQGLVDLDGKVAQEGALAGSAH